MPYLYAFGIAFFAIILETYFRLTNYAFYQIFWAVSLVQLPLGFCVYKLVTSTERFIDIAVILPLMTLGVRVISSVVIFGESVTFSTAAALGLAVAAQLVYTLWR